MGVRDLRLNIKVWSVRFAGSRFVKKKPNRGARSRLFRAIGEIEKYDSSAVVVWRFLA